MEVQLVGSPTTTASLAVAEILLRLPSPAALVRAALASKRWLGVASSPGFLRRYRSRHPSSPLLGLYVPRARAGLPSFQIADSVRSDRALAKFAHRGDFNLTGLESHPEWRFLDCHSGLLLLSRGESRAVYDPVSGRDPIWLPQNDTLPGTCFSECLLQGHGDDAASLRVVSVQHRGHDRMVRAVEYHFGTRQWRSHPWVNFKRPQCDQAMHAGRLIFWRYEDRSSLLLDTSTMEFSILGLPGASVQPSGYAIGDIEDGVCCLVGLVGGMINLHLQVWLLEENGAAKTWEPKKKVPVSQVLGCHAPLRRVHAVTNGLALLCWDQRRQLAIDLKKMCLTTEFECSALGYPLQMPWPPAVLVQTGGEAINNVVDLEAQNLLAVEQTERDMMVDIHGNKMVHGNEMISSTKLVISGSEIVQGVEMTHRDDTAEAVPPTTSRRRGNEMFPTSEMVQGIEVTHGNDTAKAAPPTTAKRQRKQSIIWEHFTTEVDADGCTRACCNYCKRTFAYSSGSKCAGTSHLKRHITLGSCPVMKGEAPPSEGGANNGGGGAAEKPSKRRCTYASHANGPFNQNNNLSYLATMINVTESLTTKQGNEYSISRCLNVLHDMDDVSDEVKHLAFHVLMDATNREIFMSYQSRLRGLWLKKEVNKLGT